MTARSKTVSDAMERIESLEGLIVKHVEKFEYHVEKQQSFNEQITARVVETEKQDITVVAKLDTILERMNNRKIGWQIWLPFSFTALMSLIAVVIQLWPKGANP